MVIISGMVIQTNLCKVANQHISKLIHLRDNNRHLIEFKHFEMLY